jgi:hypothetical protein
MRLGDRQPGAGELAADLEALKAGISGRHDGGSTLLQRRGPSPDHAD